MDGNQMYVLEKGSVTVTKGTGNERSVICDLGPGQLFGELAILYNCRRTATVATKGQVALWVLERAVFQAVVKSAGEAKDEERFTLLSKIKGTCIYRVNFTLPNDHFHHRYFGNKGALWNIRKLKFFPVLKTLSEAKLRKIADCLEEEDFDANHCIIKLGFYFLKDVVYLYW